MEYKWVQAVVKDWGVATTAKMIAILKSSGSQHLVNQITPELKSDLDAISNEIKMPSYGYYSSEGRNAGRFPPIESIKKWCGDRGIDVALAFPIAKKIATQGTKASASHFLKVFKLDNKLEQDVLDAYTLDVEKQLHEYVNKINQE
jgi:hypothetical protein